VRGALAIIDAVLARHPDRYVARLNAARWRLVTGDSDGAARDFAAAHDLSPAAAAPLVGLARVAAARGDRAAAERYVHAAERIDSSDADLRALKKELAP